MHAQSTMDVKLLGVTFIEAPPGKDKNLVPFATSGDLEKVEVNAMGLFLCEEAWNELNDAAYAAYRAELKYERSFP